MRRWRYAEEAAAWLIVAAIALLWGLLVHPGTGKRVPASQPTKLECVEWDVRLTYRDPPGVVDGEIRHCARYERRIVE